MEAPRPAHTSSLWETAPSEYDGSTPKPINKIISFGDHIHGTPPGEAEFLVIRSKINGHKQKTIRKVVFRDTEHTGETINAWILQVLSAELDTLEPIKLMNTDGQFVKHEVIKINGDASKMTLDWLIYRFEGRESEVTVEYGYNNAKKDCETETDSVELPYRMAKVESRYRVRSRL